MTLSQFPADRAEFINMARGEQEDWRRIAAHFRPFAADLPDRLLSHLRMLGADHGGFRVDRLTHSLQTATRAARDGRDDEYVICALLHDIGDLLGTFGHADVAAAILKPFVSSENHWMIENHDVFQGKYFFKFIGRDADARERFRGHSCFDRTEEFCVLYDAPSFDPHFPTEPLGFFEPALRRVISKPLAFTSITTTDNKHDASVNPRGDTSQFL